MDKSSLFTMILYNDLKKKKSMKKTGLCFKKHYSPVLMGED